jgi:FKBP-type peptidyl-prolyl cis-trans isomerase
MANQTQNDIKIYYLKKGEGPAPEVGQMVSVHYELALSMENLEKGNLIDSSYMRKHSVEFVIGSGEALRGIDQAVRKMQVGDLCRMVIESDFAFGERGVKGLVPPNSRLYVDLKLRFIG